MSILLVNSNAEMIPLADDSVHAVVTSPPYYGLRKYAIDGDAEIGLEDTPEAYLERMVAVFREVRRVLRDDGVCWVNMGDSYAGSWGAHKEHHEQAHSITRDDGRYPIYEKGWQPAAQPQKFGMKPLDLMNIPARLVLALQADGWYHRSTIIWAKPNPMPESVSGWRWERHKVKVVARGKSEAGIDKYEFMGSGNPHAARDGYEAQYTDCPGCAKCAPNNGLILRRGSWRPTTAHEYIFMLTKTSDYFADGEAVREGLAESTANDYRMGWYQAGRPERDYPGGPQHGGGLLQPNPAGRNARTVWDFPTQPFNGSKQTYHLRRVAQDEVSGGTICIPSPSCPDHAGLLVQVARDFYGERKDVLWSRIENTCNHLALKPFADYAPTDQQRALGYEVQSSGYFPRVYSPAAIDHNNENHRMALALDSNPAYIPFYEIASRIADKSRLLASFVQHLCIYGNSILPDDSDAHLLDRTPHHIVDSSSFCTSDSCSCSYYEYYTRSTDHYATYPEELPRRYLKASISEQGCCPTCGSQWARVVDKEQPPENVYTFGKLDGDKNNRGWKQAGQKLTDWRNNNPTKQLGFLPTCTCPPHEPVPAVVFDPFCGSGTTGIVARELGAHFIGLDLSYPYLHDQARDRLGLTALDAWAQGKGKQDGKVISDLPLFGNTEQEVKIPKQDQTGNRTYTGFNARWKAKE